MREQVTAALSRLIAAFKAFTAGQKAVVMVSVLVLGIGGYAFYTWSATPQYSPLFTNLAAKDASAIVDKLTAAGVTYQLADGGATVLVPKEQVYDQRLKMSGQGLPAQSDTGYSLLDQQGVTTSDFMQHVDYQRALEGELAKTVEAMDGVSGATVHLVIPQKDIFSSDASKPTASVMVSTASGTTLSGDKVQSVVHLVASSVEGLDANDVTVAGADGVLLAQPGDGAAGGAGGGTRDQQTRSFEQRMAGSLQALVNQVAGPNHAVVQVTADLDFDQTETTAQSYTPASSAPPLSESTANESYSGSGTPVGGVLGPDNIQVPGGTGGNGTYQHQNAVRDNAVDSVIETRKGAPGQVRKLGVAVLVDSTTAANVDLKALQQLASSAVGLDTTRGDTIAVNAMPFNQTAASAAASDLATTQKAGQQTQLLSLAKTGAAALLVLVLLIGTWLAGRKRRKTHGLTKADLTRLDELKSELSARGELTAGDSDGRPALPPGSDEDGDGEDARRRQLGDIEELVGKQPDEVARLLRGWMAEKVA
jgi:flagellar M-ring protein FliF